MTKYIAGTSSAPATRVWQRECCKNSTLHGSEQTGSPTARRSAHVSGSGVVGTLTARVNTVGAHGAHAKPHPPQKRSSTAIPVVAVNAKGRRRSTVSVKPACSDGTLATAVTDVHHDRHQETVGSSAGDQQHPGSPCVNVSTTEHEHDDVIIGDNVKASSSPGGLGSLDEVRVSGRFSNGSKDEDPSGEDSFDCCEGKDGSRSDPGWSSSSISSGGTCSSSSDSDSCLSSLFEDNEADVLPCPAESFHDDTEQGKGEDELPAQTIDEAEKLERGNHVPTLNESTKMQDGKALKSSRRKHPGKKKKKTRRREEVSTALGDAWSSRWLTGK